MTAKKKKNFRTLNCIESKDKDKDWDGTITKKSDVLKSRGRLPPTKDLRASWWKIDD